MIQFLFPYLFSLPINHCVELQLVNLLFALSLAAKRRKNSFLWRRRPTVGLDKHLHHFACLVLKSY